MDGILPRATGYPVALAWKEGKTTSPISFTQRTLIGFAAGLLTTVSFFPQVIKAWRSKDLTSLSGWMYAMFSAGVALWLVYGILLGSSPIIFFNAVTLCLSISILLAKLFRKN